MPDFLLEIGCEEIPARMIDGASKELRDRLTKLLADLDISAVEPDQNEYGRIFSTPRRLAVLFPQIGKKQPDAPGREIGPSLKAALKDGEYTAAAHAFAKKWGLDISDLKTESTPKGAYLVAYKVRKGRSATDLLGEALPKELSSLPWPKNMYWRNPTERFVRPVRWLVAMLDDAVIPLEFDGVRAGNQSRGHRILADGPVTIPRAGTSYYVEALEKARVISREQREKQIRETLDAATRTILGARWREDKSLLDTVINLTEWPSAILGTFDPEFLELPEEILVTVMRDHQKYFAVEDSRSSLSPHFLAVLNTDGDPEGIIRHGHERVLRARFNDARFFWQADQKHTLRERTAWLKNVTFQKDLGSYYDKIKRMQELCRHLSAVLKNSGAPRMEKIRSGIIHKAAWLSKADLTTELVKEFTELQGIVGGLYARVQELDPEMKADAREAIALAIYDHYKPKSMEDSVPRTTEGAVLSVADKADSIAGMFALGLQPTGSKDPLALRRQANGIVKTIAERTLPLKLSDLFHLAFAAYDVSSNNPIGSLNVDAIVETVKFELRSVEPFGSDDEITYSDEARHASGHKDDPIGLALGRFLRERVEFYVRDTRGYAYDVVNAVLAVGADDILDVLARVGAVKGVLHMPEFQAIAAACKRMKNILKQAGDKGINPAREFKYLPESAHEEKMLSAYVEAYAPRVEAHRQKKEYLEALLLLSTAREPVDTFFEKVMVMVEDEHIRSNRLALLRRLCKEFSTIADFSEIVTEGKESTESPKQ